MTKEKQFSFLSKDGKTKIHAVKWMPESGEYRAVLQITHGMVEYIERYKPFAEFLNDQGVLVVGHDHLGHGASVQISHFHSYHPSNQKMYDKKLRHPVPDRRGLTILPHHHGTHHSASGFLPHQTESYHH